MIQLFNKLYSMAGEDKKKIIVAFFLQFVDTFLSFVPLGVALLFFQNYLNDTLSNYFYIEAFGLLIGGVVARIFARYFMDKSSFSTIYKMFYTERIKVADHIKKINMGFFTEDNVGRVTTNLVNGISFIEEQCMNSIINIFTAIVNLVVIALMLCSFNLTLGLIYIATIVVIAVLLIPYKKQFVAYSKKHNQTNVDLTSAVIEYVKNISVIKSFHLIGKHKRSKDAFSLRRSVDLYGEKLNIPYIVAALSIMAISTSLMIYSTLSAAGDMQLYYVIMLIMISLFVFRSLETIILKLGIVIIANDSLMNIEKLYNEKIMVINGDEKPQNYDITFKNVSFSYDTQKIIDNVSFTLKENTLNALVGRSGSGKSTIVNLIPRFFDIQEGSIEIGNVDIRNMSQETLYGCISMVFQNVYLFNDTIYNNIAFGNDSASKEEVIEACKKARCHSFISALPNGYETVVGEAGLSLSGGERQRISIARAILKDTPIILLDEATASIDPDNEVEIQEAINALVKNKTILVIAHKLSCVKKADQILVVDNGHIAQSGTHDTLMKTDGLYSKLWDKRSHSKSWKIAN